MRTPESLKQSVQYFQEAISRGYVPAYSGLSDSYHLLGIYGVMPGTDARRLARDAATKGLELDPSLAEAYASRGYVSHDEFNWKAAKRTSRKQSHSPPRTPPDIIGMRCTSLDRDDSTRRCRRSTWRSRSTRCRSA